MQYLQVSLSAVGPLFLFLLLGWGLSRWKLADGTVIARVNRMNHYVFLPAMLFKNIVGARLDLGAQWRLVAMAAAASLLSCLLAVLIARLTERTEADRRAALAQGMFRNNYISYGIAIASSVFGAEGAQTVTLLIACIVPMNNVLAVIVLAAGCNGKISGKKLLTDIATNPYVIASVLGFIVAAIGVSFPRFIVSAFSDLTGLAIPLSMLMLGASFSFKSLKGYGRDIAVGVFVKLILLPLIFVPIYAAMNIRGVELLVLFIALATPPAASSHVMAGQMGADRTLAGHLIVFGSICSIATIFAWLYVLQALTLI